MEKFDPLISYMNPLSHFGAISEKMDFEFKKYLKATA